MLQVPVYNYSSSEIKRALTWKMLHEAALIAESEAPYAPSVSDIFYISYLTFNKGMSIGVERGKGVGRSSRF